jgi:hypothetical protein
MAVGTLMKIAERKGKPGVTRLLNILIEARRAPIAAIECSAIADLLWGKGWTRKFKDEDLATTIRSKSIDGWLSYVEANIKKGMNMPTKRALSIAWYKQVPKQRGSHGGE